MSYEDFWHGDPRLVAAYRNADRLRWQRFNTEAWLQGRYYFVAVSLAMSNSFSKGAGKDYLKEPFDIVPKTEEEQEIETERAREAVREQLKRMVAEQQRKKRNG